MYNKNVNYNKNLNSGVDLEYGYNDNMTIVTIGDLKLYFSYRTVIAFEVDYEVVISKNIWSNITGKHLNWIDSDHSKRISNEEFEAKLQNILEDKNLVRSDQ